MIVRIKSDHGKEFENTKFSNFCSSKGIGRELSSPITPQQNIVLECKNITLHEFKSPYNFWAEAISTACHSSNRLYLRKILDKTPYEILTGNKPNISYFRVFGVSVSFLFKVSVCQNSSPRL